MSNLRERIFDKLIGMGSDYAVEYNFFKRSNPGYSEQHKIKMCTYLMRLKLAKMKGKNPRSVRKPIDYGDVPIIESQVGRRPGEKRLFDTLRQYDLISLDIFDTAIFRKVEEPRDVFKIMSHEMGFDNFKSVRVEAEKEARLRAYSQHGSDETTLDEIYCVLEERNNIDKDKWMQREIELEMRMCVPNPYIKKAFDKLIEAGKKVIFSTDMYLPRHAIEEILKTNGYDSYEELYISAELRLSKKDATMQKHIRERYGGDCKIIHVGDNHSSDIKNSKTWGFDTLFYRSVREVSKPYMQPRYNDISGSFCRAIVNNSLHDGTWNRSIHYEHGYKVGGILLAGYCEYINSIATEKNIDLILFCARDCDVIHKTYNKLYGTVDNEYIHVSRYALMNIAPERYMVDLIDRAFWSLRGGNVSINNFLISIGLDYFGRIMEENNIRGHDKIDNGNIYKIKKTIIDNISTVLDHNKDQISSAKLYFEKMLNGHKNILIVDVGWMGSSATILKYFIENNISSKYEIHGSLLLGRNDEILSSSVSAGLINVYLSSPIKNLDISAAHFSKDNDIAHKNNQTMEYLFSSVDGSLIEYGFDPQGNVELIKGPRRQNEKEIEDMHKGMMDFAEKYEEHTKEFGNLLSISPYTAYAPFSKMLISEEYVSRIYQNFTYDAAISQGNETDAITFGRKYYPKSQKKNKILLISHDFSHTGAPHSLLRICKVLLDQGYYCEVWSPVSGGMESDFKSQGIPVKTVRPDLLYNRRIINEIKTFDFAIANTIFAYEFYSKIKKYIPAIWYIREATNISGFCNKDRNYKRYMTLKRAKDIFCVSEYAASFIKEYNKNVKIINNCVEDHSVHSRTDPHTKVRFIQLGTIEHRKGYHVLIDAFEDLDPYYKNQCELYFAGQRPSWSKDYYSTIIDKISEMENVHYLGEIKDDVEKTKIMSSMDVVVVASLDESCSLVALEGTMLSKPLIVTENVGAKYMVTNETGIIVKTADTDSLKNAIMTMIDNVAKLPEMGRASRKMYERYASMDKHRSDLESMVRSYIRDGKKNRLKLLRYRISENMLTDSFRDIVSAGSALINQGTNASLAYMKENSALFKKGVPVLENRYWNFLNKRAHKKIRLSEEHDLIVSLTSFPPRISTIHLCIESILKQYLKPNKVILYLAEEQFPNKEKDLPDSLLNLCKKGLSIEWCDDLKSHKKYYYAMLKNPESIIVTFDDDVLYEPSTLSKLYASYLRNPNSVSCLRAHRIAFDEMGSIKKYRDWKWEDNSLHNARSHQAMATGCSGILYPPGSLNKEVFNKENLMSLCPGADDLWLKTMAVANGTTVVLADRNPRLKYVDGTQESALFHQNIITGNDVSMRRILQVYNNIRSDKSLTDIIRDNFL
ncbi:MAG: glycosyltransferase [Methanomassiliicoccaceae archaeon]|nr:glycosyltransferase [Methanomassiliicoccaceae archaeon]